jgi:hypothetical protein
MILDRIARGEHPDQYETIRVTRDGRRLEVSITMSPIRDPEGRVIGASARDALRCVASPAAAAAHEINDPPAAAIGHAHPLADEVDATGRRCIDQTLEALSRIQEIGIRMQRRSGSS